MELIDILGWAALIITLVYTALGLPVQIRKNAANRSTQGLSLVMTILLFLTFSSWAIYAVFKPDQYLIVPNSVGALCALIILCQFWLYRKQP